MRVRLRQPVTYKDLSGKEVTLEEVTVSEPGDAVYQALDALGDGEPSKGQMMRAIVLACTGVNAGVFARISAADHFRLMAAVQKIVDLDFLSGEGD